MSLIFSALSEMEKQAHDGQSGRAAMPVMQSISPDRKQWPMLIGALGVLGLSAFIAVKAFAPSAAAEAMVVPATMAIASQPVAPATGSSVSKSAIAAASDSAASLAPYMQTAPEVSASGAMPVTYSTEGAFTAPATVAATLPISASAQRVAPSDAPVAPVEVAMNADSMTTLSTTASVTPANDFAVADPVSAPQAPPAPRTPPDKSYLDKTTFKLGRQPDSSKDQDVSHWVNLFSSEMSAGNHGQARSHLAKLQAKLPTQSITLLRMQAWYSVDTSDDDSARLLFLRILDRVPDDQNAGVNIALIDWRAKRYSIALARIDRLHQMYPDSSLVSQNWRSMHDQRQ